MPASLYGHVKREKAEQEPSSLLLVPIFTAASTNVHMILGAEEAKGDRKKKEKEKKLYGKQFTTSTEIASHPNP